MLRTLLDKLYLSSGILSGLCIIAICLVILARVVGRWLAIEVPSSDDFAGFLLAAASFLGLAYTFREGGHIRVSLFTARLSDKLNHYLSCLVLILATLLVLYLTWHLAYLAYESYLFEELSSGYVPVQLWLVQLPLAIGMLTFSIACIDQTICSVVFAEPIAKSEEEKIVENSHIDLESNVTAGAQS